MRGVCPLGEIPCCNLYSKHTTPEPCARCQNRLEVCSWDGNLHINILLQRLPNVPAIILILNCGRPPERCTEAHAKNTRLPHWLCTWPQLTPARMRNRERRQPSASRGCCKSTPKCREPKGSIKHAENQKVPLHGWRRDMYGSWRRRTAGGAGFAATESRRYLSKHETYLGKQIKR